MDVVYGRVLVEVGIDLQYVKQVLGDDNWIRLWIDIWYGNQSLKVIYRSRISLQLTWTPQLSLIWSFRTKDKLKKYQIYFLL